MKPTPINWVLGLVWLLAMAAGSTQLAQSSSPVANGPNEQPATNTNSRVSHHNELRRIPRQDSAKFQQPDSHKSDKEELVKADAHKGKVSRPRMMRSADQHNIETKAGPPGQSAASHSAPLTGPDSWHPHSLVPTFTDQEQGDEMVALASDSEMDQMKVLPEANRSAPTRHSMGQYELKEAERELLAQRNGRDSFSREAGESNLGGKQRPPHEEYYSDDEDEDDELMKSAGRTREFEQVSSLRKLAEVNQSANLNRHTTGDGLHLADYVGPPNFAEAYKQQRQQPMEQSANRSTRYPGAAEGGWLPASSKGSVNQEGGLQQQRNHQNQQLEIDQHQQARTSTRRPVATDKLASIFGGRDPIGTLTKTDLAIEYLKNILKSKQNNSTQNEELTRDNKPAIHPGRLYPLGPLRQLNESAELGEPSKNLNQSMSQGATKKQREPQADPIDHRANQNHQQLGEAKFSIIDAKPLKTHHEAKQVAQYGSSTTRLPTDQLIVTGGPQEQQLHTKLGPQIGQPESQSLAHELSLLNLPTGTPLGGDYIESLDDSPRSPPSTQGPTQQQQKGAEFAQGTAQNRPRQSVNERGELKQEQVAAPSAQPSSGDLIAPPASVQAKAQTPIQHNQQAQQHPQSQPQSQRLAADPSFQYHQQDVFTSYPMNMPMPSRFFQMQLQPTREQRVQSSPVPSIAADNLNLQQPRNFFTAPKPIDLSGSPSQKVYENSRLVNQQPGQAQQGVAEPNVTDSRSVGKDLLEQQAGSINLGPFDLQQGLTQYQQIDGSQLPPSFSKLYKINERQIPNQNQNQIPPVVHEQVGLPQMQPHHPGQQLHPHHHHQQQQQGQSQKTGSHGQAQPAPKSKPPKIVSYNYFESANESGEGELIATNYQLGDALYSSAGGLEQLLSNSELEAIQGQFLTAEHPIVPVSNDQGFSLPNGARNQNTAYQDSSLSGLLSALKPESLSPDLLQKLNSPNKQAEELLKELASNEDQVGIVAPRPNSIESVQSQPPASQQTGPPQFKFSNQGLNGEASKRFPSNKLYDGDLKGKKKSLIVYLNHPRPNDMSKGSKNNDGHLTDDQAPMEPFVTAKEFDSHGLSKESKHLDISSLADVKESQDKDGLSVVVIGDAYKYKKIVLLISSKSGGLKFIPMVKDMKK